jgi:tetratricopeptide (TPR) repeat protein
LIDPLSALAVSCTMSASEEPGVRVAERPKRDRGAPAGSSVGPAQAMYLVGEHHASQGDDAQARGAWISCISTGDAEWAPKAGVALGELLRRNDEPAGAEQVLRRVVETGTGRPVLQARLVLGVLAADRGDVDAALAAYRAVIAAGDPELVPVAWFDIGRLRQQAGDADAATEAYLTAMASRHPHIAPRAAVNLGVVRFEAGDRDGAREAFGLAAGSGHPEQAPMAARNLAALHALQGDTAEAARLLAQADAFDAAPPRSDLQLAQDHHAAAKELRGQSRLARDDGRPPAEVAQLASAALRHATAAFAAFERAAGTGATVPEIMEEICACSVHLDDVAPGPADVETLRTVATRLRRLRDGAHLSPEGRQLLARLEKSGHA